MNDKLKDIFDDEEIGLICQILAYGYFFIDDICDVKDDDKVIELHICEGDNKEFIMRISKGNNYEIDIVDFNTKKQADVDVNARALIDELKEKLFKRRV